MKGFINAIIYDLKSDEAIFRGFSMFLMYSQYKGKSRYEQDFGWAKGSKWFGPGSDRSHVMAAMCPD